MRKDDFVIRSAPAAAEELLQKAREIDREFIARLERFPLVRLRIRYEDVEPVRRRRIEHLLEAAAALARAPWRGIRPAARACYSRAEFEALLHEHLRLYAAEVHALSRSRGTSRACFMPLRCGKIQSHGAQSAGCRQLENAWQPGLDRRAPG